jgi:hypothetical protein
MDRKEQRTTMDGWMMTTAPPPPPLLLRDVALHRMSRWWVQ